MAYLVTFNASVVCNSISKRSCGNPIPWHFTESISIKHATFLESLNVNMTFPKVKFRYLIVLGAGMHQCKKPTYIAYLPLLKGLYLVTKWPTTCQRTLNRKVNFNWMVYAGFSFFSSSFLIKEKIWKSQKLKRHKYIINFHVSFVRLSKRKWFISTLYWHWLDTQLQTHTMHVRCTSRTMSINIIKKK